MPRQVAHGQRGQQTATPVPPATLDCIALNSGDRRYGKSLRLLGWSEHLLGLSCRSWPFGLTLPAFARAVVAASCHGLTSLASCSSRALQSPRRSGCLLCLPCFFASPAPGSQMGVCERCAQHHPTSCRLRQLRRGRLSQGSSGFGASWDLDVPPIRRNFTLAQPVRTIWRMLSEASFP